jgi:hypothetical protein
MSISYTPTRGQPLFCSDGDLLVPGVLSRGPWYEGTLHGSAMLAAMARAAERHHTDVERQVVRLTVDMMRAAPMSPLRIESSTVRSGKSIDVIDIAMFAGDDLFVRGSALRIRTTDITVDDDTAVVDWPTPPADDEVVAPLFTHPGAERPAFHHAIDASVSNGDDTVWFRLAVPVVDDEPNTSAVTVATLADWTYATPRMLREAAGGTPPDAERTVFAINADTTVNTHRPMSGAWLGLRTTSQVGVLGAGTSGAEILDRDGLVGFSTQSVLVRGPSGAPLSVKELSA